MAAGGQPDTGDVHVNSLLSNVSIAHYNDETSFVADQVFPLVYVPKQSDIYPVYDRGFFFADETDSMLRSPGTNAATTGFTITNTNTYFARNWAIGMPIPDELRWNADAPFDMDRDATLLVTQLQLIRRERAFSADFVKTSVWGTDATLSNKWNDYAASDPLGDIRTGIRTVLSNTGRKPNKVVMGKLTWDRLQDHPDIVSRVSGGATTGNPAIVNKQLVSSILELDTILVGESVYRTSNEGATLAMAFAIQQDAFLLLYTPPTASVMQPAAGYTFVWESAVNGRAAPQYIRKVREERPRVDIIEAHSYWAQTRTEQQSGYYINDAVD